MTSGFMNGEVNQTDYCGYSCSERSISIAVYVTLYVSAAAVILLTVCGNILVIISICHFKQLHTPTNLLILSLAVSDVLVGVFILPLYLIQLIESCWLFGQAVCVLYNFVMFNLTSVSVHNVTLIAVDRYFALNNPFIYSRKNSLHVAFFVILFNWVFSLFYNFALLYFHGYFTDLRMCPEECFFVVDEVWSVIDVLVVFVLPCSIIIILYIQVFAIARRHAGAIRRVHKQIVTEGSKNICDSMRSERKAAMVLGILVSVFLICLVPYYVCSLIADIIQSQSLYVLSHVYTLFLLNSSINPIIYALFYPWFQKSMKLILTFRIFGSGSSLINVLS